LARIKTANNRLLTHFANLCGFACGKDRFHIAHPSFEDPTL